MALNGISTETVLSGLTATSYTQASSYLVAVGTFNYDAYGYGFAIRKDSGAIDSYMRQVIALGTAVDRTYTDLTFSYGQATISFTLLANRTFANVVCTYGAGGYSASSGQIVMPGSQLIGGSTPENDITWDYVCAANNGVITEFSYSSGTIPVVGDAADRDWTFVPSNGQPSFTRTMKFPTSNNSTAPADGGAAIWVVNTGNSAALAGTGAGQLNTALNPNGTAFTIYTNELAINSVATKLKRRDDKLRIASYQRQGYVGSLTGSYTGYTVTSPHGYVGSNLNYIGSKSSAYRPHHSITQTHSAYVGSNTVLYTESGTGSPALAHPWD